MKSRKNREVFSQNKSEKCPFESGHGGGIRTACISASVARFLLQQKVADWMESACEEQFSSAATELQLGFCFFQNCPVFSFIHVPINYDQFTCFRRRKAFPTAKRLPSPRSMADMCDVQCWFSPKQSNSRISGPGVSRLFATQVKIATSKEKKEENRKKLSLFYFFL